MTSIAARPATLDLDLSAAAIVVVDMQNAFASPGGMFDIAGLDISGAAEAIAVNQRLLAAARQAGVQVIYLQMAYNPDLSDGGGELSPNYHKELALVQMRDKPQHYGKLLTRGSHDAQIVEQLTPQADDHVIIKTRYSGFAGTTLDSYLKSKNLRYLFFTGIATNVCVESTARDAYFNEYWPILVEDAMNHAGPDFVRQATLWNFEHIFGWVCDSEALIAAFQDQSSYAESGRQEQTRFLSP